MNLNLFLENKIKNIILSWNNSEIYAISFLVYSNESFEYNGCSNVTEFSISYNTENDCSGADELSERRWDYAFWHQNDTYIISANDNDEGMKILFTWYKENGISNIGDAEDYKMCYDSSGRYIGKGPTGYYELLTAIANVARKLQESGFVNEKFGKPVPIIIHDLEYSWYTVEATKKANPNGEADLFIRAMKYNGIIQ